MAKFREICMVRKLLFLILLLNVALLFSAPKLTGDLDRAYKLSEPGNLHNILTEIAPLCDSALLIGDDGTAVLIPAYAFREVTFIEKDGEWYSTAPKLPPVAKIRNIREICLQQIPAKYSVKIQGATSISTLTPFQFRMSQFNFLGDSAKNGFLLRKFKEQSDISNIIVFGEEGGILFSGSMHPVKDSPINYYFRDFYFEVEGDTLNIITKLEALK